MVTINNFNSNEKTLKIVAPPMETGIHSCKIVDNLQAKLVTKKSDGSKLQIIEVPCEFEGRKFTATLLSEEFAVSPYKTVPVPKLRLPVK